MATPKKKISRSRRNQRRFSCAYEIAPVPFTTGTSGDLVRTHTVTIDTIAAYVEAKKARKAAKASAKKA